MCAGSCRVLAVLALILGSTFTACGSAAERDEAAEVRVPQLPIPADAVRQELDYVVAADRSVVAETRPTVVIEGPDPATVESAWTLATGLDSRIFVLDYGSRQIVVLGSDGTVLDRQVIPADPETGLWGASAITVAGDRIVVSDLARNVLLQWNRDMEFLGQVSMPTDASLEQIKGLEDGTIVGQFVLPVGDRIAVSRFGEQAHEMTRYGVFEEPPVDPAFVLPRPLMGVDFRGSIYLAINSGYRIVSYALDGTASWALNVANWPRRELTDEFLDRLLPTEFQVRDLERTRRVGRAAGANIRENVDVVQYPKYAPALANIEVDGSGRLWVFPWAPGPDSEGRYPVDVYSPDGERLFAGYVALDSWNAALGEDVYRVEALPGAMFRVVRYRLSLPETTQDDPPNGD